MDVGRRGFLSLLGMGAVAHTFDLERLLWVPGQRTFFLPAAPTLVTPDWVAREIGRHLVQNLNFATLVNRTYDDAYVGRTVHARLPHGFKIN